MRRLAVHAAVATATAATMLLTAPGATAAAYQDNIVQSLATAQRPTVERSSVEVVAAPGATVDNNNVAFADARDCTGCRAVAVAFQAVLVPRPPTTVEPVNVALALNENCTGCTSYAFAYQYVVSTDGVRRLSWSARQRIERIEDQVEAVAESGAEPAVMDARLQELKVQFQEAVRAGLTRERGMGQDQETDAAD